jgi:hypothetical protein
MKRALAAVLIGTTVLLTGACGQLDRGQHGEITYEVTGEPGATADVVRVLPAEEAQPSISFPGEKLPMSRRASISKGAFEVHAKASKGATSCRVVVDGKEADKQMSTAGQEVVCKATVEAR